MVMEIVIALISLAGSILSIILFFKIWKACGDISSIAEKMKAPRPAILHILAGYDDDAAKELRLEYVQALRYAYLTNGDTQSVMDMYLPVFQNLGMELPEHLKDVAEFNRYYGNISRLEYGE